MGLGSIVGDIKGTFSRQASSGADLADGISQKPQLSLGSRLSSSLEVVAVHYYVSQHYFWSPIFFHVIHTWQNCIPQWLQEAAAKDRNPFF
jgi:hypothetical protein